MVHWNIPGPLRLNWSASGLASLAGMARIIESCPGAPGMASSTPR